MSKTTGGETNSRLHALEDFRARVEVHREKLHKRRSPMAAENIPPAGQAASWYYDMTRWMPYSEAGTAWHVGRQIARLCGDDSEVTITWRSLADAVGKCNKAGNLRSYTERGAKVLEDAGWLKVETVGRGRSAKTTFRLLPSDQVDWLRPSPVMAQGIEPVAEADDLDAEFAALMAQGIEPAPAAH